jgi:hypothetical protein
MAPCTVSVIDADNAADAPGDWVVFRWDAPLPAPERLALPAAAAGTADLVVLRPGRRGRHVVDLEREPDALLLDDAVLLFRRRVLRAHDLRPEPDLAPDLAAALLAARYLLAVPRPKVVVGRLRGLAATTVDRSDAGRYSGAPQRLADVLEQARGQRGAAPRWLQNLCLRQLFAYLREDRRLAGVSLSPAAIEAFHGALGRAVQQIDDEAIAACRCADATEEARAALLIGIRRRHAHTQPVRRRDPARGLTRVSYFFADESPEERVTVDGDLVRAEHHKVRAVLVVGKHLLAERIVWIPDTAQLRVDGAGEVVLHRSPAVRPSAVRYRTALSEKRAVVRIVARDLRIRWRARGIAARRRYRAAWLLMDRDVAAQDNAEHLYRYLVAAEPDINAWFVLARDSPDWPRLEREGFRLIDYGSVDYFTALLNCAHLISSQADDYVCLPFRRHMLGRPRWRFTFLQHGVLSHDLSRWLNSKPIDCFVTSTPSEHEAIVGDQSPYVFTDLEVQMVGLARHDRLLRLAQHAERRWLLVMPTWRPGLLGGRTLGNSRALLAGFWDSEYARAWRGFLADESLRSLCEEQDWQLTFVPHPNMQDYLDGAQFPEHVKALRFGHVDVQVLIAGAAALVTDYSSLANEAAYIGRPVVYYQFDRDEFFGDFRRLGSWSYEHDGFGRVTETVHDAVAALESIALRGGAEPEYADRIARGFPLRDGQCCARTVAAIRAIEGS